MEPTRGTDTSKYPEEKKTNVIPPVVASEKGRAQTEEACLFGVEGPHTTSDIKQNLLESRAIDGESPVCVNCRESVGS